MKVTEFEQQVTVPPFDVPAALGLSARLAAIERTLDEKRKEHGIPGLSLVIVRDDEVVLMKGLGWRDVERRLPVTPQTLFPIGSCTKSFTAMAAMLSVDDGKLALDDSPKKYLPYFKLRDQEADAKVTIRDLLTHRSGVNATDLSWTMSALDPHESLRNGVLSREEVIRVAGLAKPTARLREKFQYTNTMFSAIGEIVAKAQNMPWEDVVASRIFKPLGMHSSNTSVRDMHRSPDFSFGYEYIPATGETRRLPKRNFSHFAASGGINSNALDMAQWLKLMIGGGIFNGQRFVSEEAFSELIAKQIYVSEGNHYGFGWFLSEWRGRQVIGHKGTFDGYDARIAVMPEERLGFVLLTNVSSSHLGKTARECIWSNLVDEPQTAGISSFDSCKADSSPSPELAREVGAYKLPGADFVAEVKLQQGKLLLVMPGQPPYTLEGRGERRYEFSHPAASGVSVSFRPVKDNSEETELYLEQPQGNLSFLKVDARQPAPSNAQDTIEISSPEALKELEGFYSHEWGGEVFEVAWHEGRLSLIAPHQPPVLMVERGKDSFTIDRHSSIELAFKRDAGRKISGLLLKRPEGGFDLKRLPEVSISIEELMSKVIDATGGEANMRKHHSMVMKVDMDYENQGMTAKGVISAQAPCSSSAVITYMALGKEVGSQRQYFDGTTGGAETSFSPSETLHDSQLDNAKIEADFYRLLNWKTTFKTIKIKGLTRSGNEHVYIVLKTPHRGSPITYFISAQSFLIVKRERAAAGTGQAMTEWYRDYRLVDGVMVPFKVDCVMPAMGHVRYHVREVSFDVDIPDGVFRASAQGTVGA